MRRLLVPIAALLVLLGIFLWWWYRPERVVARRVAGLFEAANVAADSGDLTRSTRGEAIGAFLADRISFEGPEGPTEEVEGPQDRDSIVGLYTGLAKYCRSASITDLDIESVTVEGDEAKVIATMDAIIELPNAERPVDGIQNLDMTWTKSDGKWQLSSAKWKETPRQK